MITPDVEQYLKAVRIPLRLACTTSDGWPVVLSLWFEYNQGLLYCASHQQAKVIAFLRGNPRCAFEVAGDQPPYCGIRGQGTVTLDNSQGAEILERLLKRYLGGLDNPLAQKLLSRRESEIAIIIEPLKMFSWNFTQRMKETVGVVDKPCPG
jgi:nitroimidazol reductase NimA-like FMN-containing flavoprotein (pyridoxamine 5'-phosphate oxidase superfamily)